MYHVIIATTTESITSNFQNFPSTYFRWSEQIMHTSVKCLFQDMPAIFFIGIGWYLIDTEARAKEKFPCFLLRHGVGYERLQKQYTVYRTTSYCKVNRRIVYIVGVLQENSSCSLDRFTTCGLVDKSSSASRWAIISEEYSATSKSKWHVVLHSRTMCWIYFDYLIHYAWDGVAAAYAIVLAWHLE